MDGGRKCGGANAAVRSCEFCAFAQALAASQARPRPVRSRSTVDMQQHAHKRTLAAALLTVRASELALPFHAIAFHLAPVACEWCAPFRGPTLTLASLPSAGRDGQRRAEGGAASRARCGSGRERGRTNGRCRCGARRRPAAPWRGCWPRHRIATWCESGRGRREQRLTRARRAAPADVAHRRRSGRRVICRGTRIRCACRCAARDGEAVYVRR